MKKLLIAMVLIGLIIGVSYLKSARESKLREEVARRTGERIDDQVRDLRLAIDSLQSEITASRQKPADSAAHLNTAYRQRIDSLQALLDSQTTVVQTLRKKTADNSGKQSKTASSTVSQKKSDTNSAAHKPDQRKLARLHERILKYYKKRYSNLPADLTRYERKVALDEIRKETAQHFAISTRELDRIRKENRLSY